MWMGWISLKMGVVLPFYSPRVDFTMRTSILLGWSFGLLLLGLVAPMVSSARSCAIIPLVWRRVLSVHHMGSCSYSDIDVVVLGGSYWVSSRWGLEMSSVKLHPPPSPKHHLSSCVGVCLVRAYCLVPSGVWVIVETSMLRSMRLELTGPTSQWGYVSCIVLDRDPLVLLPQSRHGLVMIRFIVPSWIDSTWSALPPIEVFVWEPVLTLLGCSAGRLIGIPSSPSRSVGSLIDSPASLGCSALLLGEWVGRQPCPTGLLVRRIGRAAPLGCSSGGLVDRPALPGRSSGRLVDSPTLAGLFRRWAGQFGGPSLGGLLGLLQAPGSQVSDT
jgi:hypothetical protein